MGAHWSTAKGKGLPLTPAQREAKRAYERKYWRLNKHRRDKKKEYMGHLLRRYGITKAQYLEMELAQGRRCKICRNPPGPKRCLCVDHDHVTGKVRSLLCDNCNKSLGCMAEDPARLRAAADYLESFR